MWNLIVGKIYKDKNKAQPRQNIIVTTDSFDRGNAIEYRLLNATIFSAPK